MKKLILSLFFTLFTISCAFAYGETADNGESIPNAAVFEKDSEQSQNIQDDLPENLRDNTESEQDAFVTENDDTSETELSQNPEVDTSKEDIISSVNLYIFGNGIALSHFPVFENTVLMLPIQEYLSHLGANDFSVDSENQITVTYGEKIAVMHIDSTDAVINNENVLLPAAPFYIDGIVYAPAEIITKELGFTFKSDTDYNTMSVYTDWEWAQTSAERYVNSKNLSSDTQYLIWVNKSKYTVYVFLGTNGSWREVYSCRCSIGASGTPTVTGTFKYFSKEKKWIYDNFYVGPIMRFYGGYAIHSTLLRYDGSDYNNAVGVKNSHGCVRVRPQNLDWLISYVPLKSTVHVTEN